MCLVQHKLVFAMAVTWEERTGHQCDSVLYVCVLSFYVELNTNTTTYFALKVCPLKTERRQKNETADMGHTARKQISKTELSAWFRRQKHPPYGSPARLCIKKIWSCVDRCLWNTDTQTQCRRCWGHMNCWQIKRSSSLICTTTQTTIMSTYWLHSERAHFNWSINCHYMSNPLMNRENSICRF